MSIFKKKNIDAGALRRTQLITTYGPGSIVNMPDYSVIMASIDAWDTNRVKEHQIHERNLERMLQKKYFVLPPSEQNNDFTQQKSQDIPAYRFPRKYYCPKCGKLDDYRRFVTARNKNTCPNCKKKLVPSRFLVACINGHIDDFPYSWWVHSKGGSSGKCQSPDLRIEFKSETGDLDSIIIKCASCGASRSMAGCMGVGALDAIKCKGRKPWLASEDSADECKAHLITVQRGSSNTYFPIIVSALTIPPWSNILYQEVEKKWEFIAPWIESGITEEQVKPILATPAYFGDILSKGYTIDDVLQAIKRRLGNGTEEYSRQLLFQDEYKVFTSGNYSDENDRNFRISHCRVENDLAEYIDSVVMVKRLREVMALKGFRRITPEIYKENNPKFAGFALKDGCTQLGENVNEWLPAIELLGEGIFLCLNEEKVAAWEHSIGDRYFEMAARLEIGNMDCKNFSPRYVLLHTISHMLIKQLSIECGYSGAAIKERIYSTYPGSEQEMAGILLYTSSPDADGSLGGLARQALPKAFAKVFFNMLEEASWCSSDPICYESKAQGFNSLNYAACHACAILPETSCEMRNCLLDRVAVVGTPEDRSKGFFGELFL